MLLIRCAAIMWQLLPGPHACIPLLLLLLL
jgi:hypothetical protein